VGALDLSIYSLYRQEAASRERLVDGVGPRSMVKKLFAEPLDTRSGDAGGHGTAAALIAALVFAAERWPRSRSPLPYGSLPSARRRS
jgi:hypothetical protein